MTRWIINCEEYSKLISQQMDRSLSLRNRMFLRIHQWICPSCSCIKQNFSSIRQACRWVPPDEANDSPNCDTLPEEVVARIKSAIKTYPKQTP